MSRKNYSPPEVINSHQRVGRAIKKGLLPEVTSQMCLCGSPARVYHHIEGYDEADVYNVIALCDKCHSLVHIGRKRDIPAYLYYLAVKAENPDLIRSGIKNEHKVLKSAIKKGSLPEPSSQLCLCGRSAISYHRISGDRKAENDYNVIALCTRCHRLVHHERHIPSYLEGLGNQRCWYGLK